MKHTRPLAFASLLLALGSTACRPETPTPPNQPPAPQTAAVASTDATALRDAINQPLDRARSVESTVQAADARKRAAIEAQQ